MRTKLLIGILLWTSLVEGLWAGTPVPGKNTVLVRSRRQTVYFYPGSRASADSRGIVFYLPGDIGMFGFGATIAKTVSSWGYDVYGLDTRSYLSSFTGANSLTENQVMLDFLYLADWMRAASPQKITLVGWSEGAGLCLLAAASPEATQTFSGLITFGLTEFPALAWHWSDLLSTLVNRTPKEPSFSSAAILPQITPLPFLMIQSSGDQYVSVAVAQRLFSLAQKPKRFQLISARNHRFEGNQAQLFQTIRDGLEWIQNFQRQAQ